MAKKPASKKDQVEVVAIKHNFAGKYRLAANYGQSVFVDKKQADEILKAGDGMEPAKWAETQKKAESKEDNPSEDTE